MPTWIDFKMLRRLASATYVLCLIMLVFLVTHPSRGDEFQPFAGPKPLAVFIQTEPHTLAIGTETPRVAIYEDGNVIFVKRVDGRLAYYRATVNRETLAALRDDLKPVLALKEVKKSYNVRPGASSQPHALFYLSDGDRVVATRVYGLVAPRTRVGTYTEYPTDVEADVLPEALVKLHKQFCRLDFEDSKPWTPKYLKVMLWDYSNAPEPSIQWPQDWPALDSDRAMKKNEVYFVYLDGALLPKLRAFLASQNDRGAIEANGEKLTAVYRFTFPSEPLWREPLAATLEQE